jgi:ribose transport system ATP-binding protein
MAAPSRWASAEITVRSPAEAIGHGIAYLSEDRKGEGLAVRMSVAANMTLANMAGVARRLGFIDFEAEQAAADKYIAALGIRRRRRRSWRGICRAATSRRSSIGKWLFRRSKIIFFDEPTRGIDVGAKLAIYKLLDSWRATASASC